MSGEEVVIAKAGWPIARLLPYTLQPEQRTPGIDAGKIAIEPNFNDPLPEFADR